MIVDCHTHVWEYPKHISRAFNEEALASTKGKPIHVELSEHKCAMQDVDHAIVLGFQTEHLGVHVPNDYVAEYCSTQPDHLIGFASVDPNAPDALAELRRASRELGLQGLKLAPIYQDFHPQDQTKAYPLYQYCENEGLPVLFHMGTTFASRAPLEVSRPILLEQVALDFPKLRMVVAHLGHPWETETTVLIRKQPNIYADIAALYYRPWQFYNSLVMAMEYGVLHKLLFGSDYPFTTPEATIEAMGKVDRLTEGTSLPGIPQEEIEKLVHRDTLGLLGLRVPGN